MTAEQSLAGAMGCASWRARLRLLDYAAACLSGGQIRGGPITSPVTHRLAPLGLNEVGVTDAVMAALWRFGPKDVSYVVSTGAETNHLGADIAFLHRASNRILVYQAKLGRFDGTCFFLKSDVTASQMRLLGRRSVKVDGAKYGFSGRLAIYQADNAPFLGACQHFGLMEFIWGHETGPFFTPEPEIGSVYYRDQLRHGCSPSGILACRVSGKEPITTVDGAGVWPWEFDVHSWLLGRSPLNDKDSGDRELSRAPDFPEFREGASDVQSLDAEFAERLARALRLPTSHRLYVIAI
jgi:hypothetical protein